MRIDIEEIKALKKRIAEINSTPIENIEWLRNGKPIPKEEMEVSIEEWKYIGLTNFSFTDFIKQ